MPYFWFEVRKVVKKTERDLLAEERTALAEERTFLAILRTAFGIIALGIAIAGFLEEFFLVGLAISVAGLVVGVYSLYFHKTEIGRIRGLENRNVYK